MAEVVVDASAVLAFINREPGHEAAEAVLPESLLSAVNLSEIVGRLSASGAPPGAVRGIVARLPCRVVEFDRTQAVLAGEMRPSTAAAGLSLGDRACLALARMLRLPAVTADRVWLTLELGVDVRLIR